MSSTYRDKAFNTQLMNLIKELIRLYPNDSDFVLMKHTIFFASTSSTATPRKVFSKNIKPYVKYIEDRDESFFLNTSTETYIAAVPDGDEKDSKLIDKLKQIWKNMDDKTHESVWLYLNVLIKLIK